MSRHLEGWEWRKSKKSLEKKARAKAKHFADEIAEDAGNESAFVSEIEKDRKAVVAEVKWGKFTVLLNDKILTGVPLGPKLDPKLGGYVVPGDHVEIIQEGLKHYISSIQKRTTNFSRFKIDSTRRNGKTYERVIAANIDVAAIIASARDPPFHPRLVDRYLIITQKNNIEPIICINKSDLTGEEGRNLLDNYKQLGAKIIFTSTITNEGIEELKGLLRGKQAIFVGHSGVGKSSLINAITGKSGIKVGEVSEKTGKGKHTTTSSILYKWGTGSYIIDTPGVRVISLLGVTPRELQLYFSEFSDYMPNCKYSDCNHRDMQENDCGIMQAVKQGSIPQWWYDSYIRILDEISPVVSSTNRMSRG